MSDRGDDQAFHSPGPQSGRPAGHDAQTSEAGGGSPGLGATGANKPAVKDPTAVSPTEGSVVGSDRQTRSRGQAIPVCLGPLDKPVFDERFATPIGEGQFIEESKEQKSSGIVSALEHIVRSAQRHRTDSKLFKTPQATATSPSTSLPYPIGPSTFYTSDERVRRREESVVGRRGTGQVDSSTPVRGASWTPPSSGNPDHLTNPVNLPDESIHGLVNPFFVGGPPSPLETPARPLAGGSFLTAPEKKRKEKVSHRVTSDQDTIESQIGEKQTFTPHRLVWRTVEGETENYEYLQLRTDEDEDNGIEVIHSEELSEGLDIVEPRDLDPQQILQIHELNPQVEINPRDRQEPEDSLESEPDENDRQELESEPELISDPSEQELSDPSGNESGDDTDPRMANPPPPQPAVAERGPTIRLPWFTGKEDEQVEKYFRELKRLKAIYKWQDEHLLNMTLLGLRGRADDWASALPDGDKDTFDKLEQNMVKIFGDKRAQWQKHADFGSLKQAKEQSVIEFAGVLKQKQAKSEATPAMMMAVFLDGLKPAIGRQVAILDPKTFEEAVASATRLETLDRSKTNTKITGAVAEVTGAEDKKETNPMNEMIDRFGVVLARLETLPPPAPTPTDARNKNFQRGRGRPTAFFPSKNYPPRTDNQAREPGAAPVGRGQEQGQPRGGAALGNRGGYYKRGSYRKFDYDRSKYCLAHQTYGHATDSCSWLKGKLKQMGPPERAEKKEFVPSSERREPGNWRGGPANN